MKSKKSMDITQLNAYYQNNLYILGTTGVDRNRQFYTCLCKKCHRYFFIPTQTNDFNIKCKYCNQKKNNNPQIKEILKQDFKEKKESYKNEYKNNKQILQSQNFEKQAKYKEQIKNNLQTRILEEFKQKKIKLTEEQKAYLQEQKNLNSGSNGEKAIATLLTTYNIPFEREKTFPDLRYTNTNKPPRFDFYVNNEYIIEFDGQQHFKGGFEKMSGMTLEEQQTRDEFKNTYCFKNNIPIIRIPYWHLNDLCIEDLQLNTSSFVFRPLYQQSAY